MEYDYRSRQKLVEEYKGKWKRKLILASGETKEAVAQMEKFGQYRPEVNAFLKGVEAKFRDGGFLTPSELMNRRYKKLVDLYAGKAFAGDFYYIIDKLNQFPYSHSVYRRSVRTQSYLPCLEHVFRLLYACRVMNFYECTLEDYLLDRLSEEKLDYKRHPVYGFTMPYLDDLIAARIDRGDEAVTAAVKDILLSDNNTAVVTVDLIRGIIKSSCAPLHRLLSDFLLAARLQEGVRQAICENADCGTVEAFQTIFAAVCDNNLIRFASVKRAVAVWTGICDVENADRISDKMLVLMKDALNDPKAAKAYISSNDSIRIAAGLWALAFYELQDALEVMGNFLEHGTRNQILTMSYFNRTLEWEAFTGITAKKALLQFSSDPEIAAAFMPTYLSGVEEYARYALGGGRPGNTEEKTYMPIPLNWMFDSREEALEHYGVLKGLLEGMKKKKLEFTPCVFPWYGVELSRGQLIKRMCVIAYALEDPAFIEDAAGKVMEIDISGTYESRSKWVELLLHSPQNERQKALLLSFLGDKETMTRKTAFRLVEELELSDADYPELEGLLKYKKEDIRQNVLKLLEKQGDKGLEESAKRLLSSPLQAVREGGLSLVREARIKGRSGELLARLAEEAGKLEGSSDKEQILLEEVRGGTASSQILETEGYGLYRRDVNPVCPKPTEGRENLRAYFRTDPGRLEEIVRSLYALLDENADLEYKAANGYEMLLGNHLAMISHDASLPLADRYPFKELWIRFYQEHIRDPHLVKLLLLAWGNGLGEGYKVKREEKLLRYERLLLGDLGKFRIPQKQGIQPGYGNSPHTVLTILNSIYGDTQGRCAALEMAALIAEEIPAEDLWYEKIKDTRYYYVSDSGEFALTDITAVNSMIRSLTAWKTEEEFKEGFFALYRLDQLFDYNAHHSTGYYTYNRNSRTLLTIYEYIRAFWLGLIPADTVYKAAFETIGLGVSLEDLSRLVSERLLPYDKNRLSVYLSEEELAEEKVNPENPFVKQGKEFLFRITDTILDVELKRGDLPTVFSSSISSIKRIYGMERMIDILKALGNDKLDRAAYYYWTESRTGKRECLSYLLQICYPLEGEDAGKLKALLKGTRIKEQKIIETAMYAPQWLDIIEEYLGWPGLKSGCYYFMAHMNERFDDKKKAMIARYTPLSPEELNNGAFDLNWFEEAYALLGEERFGRLYDAAKYISDGSKHARARKYADAALGRVTAEEMEPVIREKRNKDLLMSYGLAPVREKKELPHRYEFLQQFLKESRQFGAQRRASEALAVSVAMKNMATKAGFADVTRLTLAMETELVKEYAPYFDKKEEEGVLLQLQTDESGRPSIKAQKAGKALKSVPAGLKKNAYYLKLKEIHTKLKEQYSRCVKMFEQAMEEREAYRYEELQALCENPVTKPVVQSLVFIRTEREESSGSPALGFLKEEGISDWEDNYMAPEGEELFRVAHPADLYEAGCWRKYQKKLFAEEKKQPFKQVFRELYLKLPEELDRTHSLMFAGNQIQPAKTAACLKTRRWVADYEEGLQKIYYKENIIAHIYARADWFSPSDIEAPTLEWVEFTHRKTGESMKIRDIPAIVYSEVMRDVDLAVSVAHAGGVDPETSHSTVEMRKAVVEYNLPLFGIDNVTLEGSHALIKGSRGNYSIHLGSGVIHRQGGRQIQVLPVPSQSRGKLFLPFLDEDPKTAEIMSKIVLFAGDTKIKDPYILDQLQE